jgi:hypothetical protein
MPPGDCRGRCKVAAAVVAEAAAGDCRASASVMIDWLAFGMKLAAAPKTSQIKLQHFFCTASRRALPASTPPHILPLFLHI